MFNNLIKWLTEPNHPSWDRVRLNEELEKVRKFCLDNDLGYYPELLRRLPRFAPAVNKYIKKKARQDLPPEQFDRHFFSRDLSKLVEIGGLLDFNDQLTELAYHPPDTDNVVLEWDIYQGMGGPAFVSENIARNIYGIKSSPIKRYTSSVTKTLPNGTVDNAMALVDWHSHPKGYGEPSNDDMVNLKEFLELRGDKPYYFLLFQPHLNQS